MLLVCVAGGSSGHGHDHGGVDRGFVVFGRCLVVVDAAVVFGDPFEGWLDDPPVGQYDELGDVVGTFDDLDGQG